MKKLQQTKIFDPVGYTSHSNLHRGMPELVTIVRFQKKKVLFKPDIQANF